MKKREQILNELEELDSRLGKLVSADNVFTVPEGYFDEFPVKMLGKISSNDAVGSVPQGYFEGLSVNIMARIRQEEQNVTEVAMDNVIAEMESLSPSIAAIGNRNPFTVQEGYFQTLSEEILAATIKTQAPVVSMRRSPAILRYLAAAAFTGLVGFSLFTMFTNNQAEVKGMDPSVMAQAKTIVANDSFDETLASLSASDIESYLTANGHNPDVAVVASAINDESLPDPVDYLINENTLNEFLTDKNLAN